MSSTYVHYSTGPSSLPSDYALLSRYASSRNRIDEDLSTDHETDDNSDHYEHHERRHITKGVRRGSLPTEPTHPVNSSQLSLPLAPPVAIVGQWATSNLNIHIPSENTPLLGHPVPRIEEEDYAELSDVEGTQQQSSYSLSANWDEIKTLLKYTLPVYG